jgi:DNA polymerase-3 subunit gamma/tau
MALNCADREGGEPCGECDSCERIWAGRASLDVVEIDAASHRGVEDARDLRQRAMYAPTTDERYKVYIVDEAHMLTRDAWNALLKILEEPPPRVVFAFATTEPQKIEQGAAPVLSRCQRFDFRRVAVPDLVGRLETVLEREKVSADEGALLSLARRADGGVRDALSLLDQVLSFSGDEVRLDDVRRMLGLVDEDRYLEFFEIVGRHDRAAVFGFVQSLLDAGDDPTEFIRGLGDALRAMLVLRTDPKSEALDIPPESRERFAQASSGFSPADLLRYLIAVSEFEATGTLRRSSQHRIQLEVLLLRIACMDSTVELAELLDAVGGSSGSAGPDTEGGSRVPTPSPAVEGGPAAPSPAPKSDGEGRDGEGRDGAGGGARAGSEPPSGAAPGPSAAGDLLDAWQNAVRRTRSLGGQAIALRGVSVQALDGTTLRLAIPDGLFDDLRPLLEDRGRSAALRDNLALELGIDVGQLDIEISKIGGGRRLTSKEAREHRMSRWMERDPRLREAVEELDLTLKE